ncbi:MAG: carbon monoxide dehydrogenase subunit G [Burkholderiaceae bacterium]|nr:carbon monoxide dehydrogenase subunit G [Burkholderiaceae bacterium]
MQLRGERLLAADRATAWAALNDVEVLKLCVPGCESMTQVAPDEYEIALQAAIGPVKARFKGRMKLADVDAPRGYTLKFDGAGGPAGFARGEARVELAEVGPRQTRLTYAAEAQVGGKLAQVGSRLIDAASGAMADKFFEAFAQQLAARAAPAPAGAAPAPAPAAGFGLLALLKAFLRRLFGR